VIALIATAGITVQLWNGDRDLAKAGQVTSSAGAASTATASATATATVSAPSSASSSAGQTVSLADLGS
jgi:hypothetical protein